MDSLPIKSTDDLLLDRAREALKHVKDDGFWQTWIDVGLGVRICRDRALEASNSKDMNSNRAKKAIAIELKKERLDTLDKSLRSDLLTIIDHQDEIEMWRRTLGVNQREKWTYPRTILKQWKTATGVLEKDGETSKKPAAITAFKAECQRLSDENSKLIQKLKIAENNDFDEFMNNDPVDLANIYFRKNPTRASKLYAALGQLLQQKKPKAKAQPGG
jgi:hypothetical protein